MSKMIYLDAPNVGKLEKKYLNAAIDTGYVSTIGPYVPEFEAKFAKYLGIKKAVSTQSGTAAIHMALYELGIGRGDEVIVPALTFVATVNPIFYVGAKPVFVDIDISTWNILPQEIEKNITKKTKAILPVHLYGNPCEMDSIRKIAKRHNLYVIEDATESLGATYRKRYTGTFGDFGCFSFNGNKIIATGGGGMIAGNATKKLEHIKFLVNQARDESKEYYHPEIGFNYRMTNIEAALGLAQLKRLSGFLEKKKRFNRIYREELRGIDSIIFQEEYSNAESSFWLTCIRVKNEADINALQQKLNAKDVPARRIFMPLIEFPPYKCYKKQKITNAYKVYSQGLCLPSSTLNSEKDIHYVCKVIRDVLC
jgi:perosamine synthetase